MNTVQISAQAATALSALVSDISTIDTRAKCSDRFFRQHFMLVVNTIHQTGILRELEKALLEREPESAEEIPNGHGQVNRKRRKSPTADDEAAE